ncbi:Nicotinate-nucleotide pyrophosphorylase (carboxylating) [Sedimentisphaera cyanobacteriorum]|uniref:Probable nicotinate-nucleotide pyrophosphorylase [carboxylating] n=1 Tax=Sedimentisphaera cyanobacteriorum TaxID=1940790 RepID=A0A1Q2HLR6_9BACT|nr:carboxylating nicotinate-nucleotide diphosphorylase [Sedimentisphaera cyanobacteriorum]AQQ08417.1 Nicotinate-nucleotide pyrophosphorylase (carboxylating) [Sedimentisphaera cyanobacteriorum]
MKIKPIEIERVLPLIKFAVEEDFGGGDHTTRITIPPDSNARTYLRAREDLVFCGREVAELVLQEYSSELHIDFFAGDGHYAKKGETLAAIYGPLRAMLSAERVLLNFLQRLCGVSTATKRYVDIIKGTGAGIYDTRKTTPGWRELEKFAVRCGGGFNHRYNLSDAVMLKDNHFAHLGEDHESQLRRFVDMSKAVEGVKFVCVEVDELAEQFHTVLKVEGVDIILLDNMSPEQMSYAVEVRNETAPHKELEASGGITEQTLRAVAQTGVDRISIGALTHGARSVDLGLDDN